MNHNSVLANISGLTSSIIAASSLNSVIDIKDMSYSAPLSPPTNLSPMDITDGGPSESREDSADTAMNSSGQPSPGTSRQNSQFSGTPASTSTSPSSAPQSAPSSSVKFPKQSQSLFASHVIPPTPPAPSPPAPTSNTKTSPRPRLPSRLSSRSGGKRHASIGSARELPFPGPPPPTNTTNESTAQNTTQTAHVTADGATPGWNARLREMGLHIPGLGSPRSPRSGSMSSGAASPKSPEEQRAASYFSFRRRGSSSNVNSPGKTRKDAATPPPPPPPPSLQQHAPEAAKRQKDKPSPITEEVSSPVSPAPVPKHLRANLSLDLSTTLTSRGSTASLPLIGHTPVDYLVGEPKQRRASMVAPAAPPPHVHTPPVHPPSYEYPFLPHHAPRQPLEVRVEEVPPGPNSEAGSWVVSVRLPGFQPDGITVGTRRGRVLMIVADNYNEDDGAGHFERRISFGYDADMAAIRAEFNGDMLRVTVPRRWMFGPMMMMPRSSMGGMNLARPTIENPNENSRT